MSNKKIVSQAMAELFDKKDTSAVDRWVAPDYTQHNPQVSDGPEGLRGFVATASEQLRYEPIRVLADGDLVALHAIYHDVQPGQSLVAFDIFRLRDGKLAEHWDALTPVVEQTVSGRSQVDGPADITHPAQTDQSHKVAAGFVEAVLIGGQTDRITDYISTEQYHQHNPSIADGLDGLTAWLTQLADQGIVMAYRTLHRVVADGEFVLTQSEGSLGGKPTAFYDLFRIQDAKIIEHWDVINEIPTTFANTNGMF